LIAGQKGSPFHWRLPSGGADAGGCRGVAGWLWYGARSRPALSVPDSMSRTCRGASGRRATVTISGRPAQLSLREPSCATW